MAKEISYREDEIARLRRGLKEKDEYTSQI